MAGRTNIRIVRKPRRAGPAGFICVHVGRQHHPILFASRDTPTLPADSGWCLACGRPGHTIEDWLLVKIARYFEADPSLAELLGMPEGYQGERMRPDGEWLISVSPPDPD